MRSYNPVVRAIMESQGVKSAPATVTVPAAEMDEGMFGLFPIISINASTHFLLTEDESAYALFYESSLTEGIGGSIMGALRGAGRWIKRIGGLAWDKIKSFFTGSPKITLPQAYALYKKNPKNAVAAYTQHLQNAGVNPQKAAQIAASIHPLVQTFSRQRTKIASASKAIANAQHGQPAPASAHQIVNQANANNNHFTKLARSGIPGAQAMKTVLKHASNIAGVVPSAVTNVAGGLHAAYHGHIPPQPGHDEPAQPPVNPKHNFDPRTGIQINHFDPQSGHAIPNPNVNVTATAGAAAPAPGTPPAPGAQPGQPAPAQAAPQPVQQFPTFDDQMVKVGDKVDGYQWNGQKFAGIVTLSKDKKQAFVQDAATNTIVPVHNFSLSKPPGVYPGPGRKMAPGVKKFPMKTSEGAEVYPGDYVVGYYQNAKIAGTYPMKHDPKRGLGSVVNDADGKDIPITGITFTKPAKLAPAPIVQKPAAAAQTPNPPPATNPPPAQPTGTPTPVQRPGMNVAKTEQYHIQFIDPKGVVVEEKDASGVAVMTIVEAISDGAFQPSVSASALRIRHGKSTMTMPIGKTL